MATPPKLISDRPLEPKSVAVEGPARQYAGKAEALWQWAVGELKPVLVMTLKKLAGMLNQPPFFGQPLWDGQVWRSVRLGSLAEYLIDADETLTVFQGDHHVQRADSASAPRVKTLSAAGAVQGNAKFLWNMSDQTLTFGTAIVAAGYYCESSFDGAAWIPLRILRIVGDPPF